jgi:shikimate kinase
LFSTDDWVELHSGQTIAEIFVQHGESRFRTLETEAVRLAALGAASVVDLGGGAILSTTNRERIRESGAIVWLKANADVLWQRVQADPRTAQSRPPLTTAGGLDEMRSIVVERESLYAACADYEIDTGALLPHEIARRVASRFALVDKQKRNLSARG